MGLFTTECVVRSDKWIFDGAGGMRDQLEQTILKCLQEKQYPMKASVETVKSGGLFGSSDRCVSIDTGNKSRIVIANTTVGTYLYVGVYLLKPFVNGTQVAAVSEPINDFLVMQQREALYAAAIATTEYAFTELGIQEALRKAER